MIAIETLPHLNAVLNALAAGFLILGYVFIRRKNPRAHRAAMISAVTVSGLFLISYVTLRFNAPIFEFPGTGIVRGAYYTLLISHVSLAIAIVPLALITFIRALNKGGFGAHKRIAKRALPVWMYVSVSGVAVYLMLYQVYSVELVLNTP